jgi:hypothetical protein
MSLFNISKIKLEARSARRTTGVTISAYLNAFARNQGFHTWDSLLRAQTIKMTASSEVLVAKTNMDPCRKLMVLGLNRLLGNGLVTLDGKDEPSGHFITELAGETSVIIWHGISGDELSLAVWWKYDHAKHPQANLEGNEREQFHTSQPLAKRHHYPKFVGVIVSGWLERKTGKHLQGHDRDYLTTYMRRGERDILAVVPNPIPAGFLPEGRFFR